MNIPPGMSGYPTMITRRETMTTPQNHSVKQRSIDKERKRETAHGLAGLVNLGNTCYMNAIIQCLSSLDYFRNYLITNEFFEDLKNKTVRNLAAKKRAVQEKGRAHAIEITSKEVSDIIKITVTYQLYKVLKRMWTENCEVVPDSLKFIVGEHNEEFKGYKQNDSHELLNLVLEQIDEEMSESVKIKFNKLPEDVLKLIQIHKKFTKIMNSDCSDEQKVLEKKMYEDYCDNNRKTALILQSHMYWIKIMGNKYSIISNLFTGLYCSQIRCDTCNNITSTFESFTSISLQIPDNGSETLGNCLKEFSKSELLIKEEKFKCEKCRKLVNATKRIFVWESPKILIIHFKRFKNIGRRIQKINTKIEYPIKNLRLNQCSSPLYPLEVSYNLQAVCLHHGSYSSGHYVAYCKNSLDNNWYHFNDNNVECIPEDRRASALTSQHAYILFYVQNRL